MDTLNPNNAAGKMKNVLRTLFLMSFGLISACASAPDVYVPQPVSHEQLSEEIQSRAGKVIVVNYWATWCAPCIKEFPEFIKIGKEFADQGVDVMFVSADFEADLPLVSDFLKTQGVPWKSYWKTGKDHAFINAMHEAWSGALPATMIYGPNGTIEVFWEGLTTYEELKRNLQDVLNS